MEIPSRICTKCKSEKPLDQFPATRKHRCHTCNALKAKRWREKNPQRSKELNKRSREKNRAKNAATNRAWRASSAGKAYVERSKSKREETNAKWRHSDRGKEWRREYMRRYRQEREKRDIAFRIGRLLRGRIRDVFQGKVKKTGSAICLLGATFEQVRLHIEKQWQKGMSWENHGHVGEAVWHIDHIIPIAAFDITDPEQQRKAFHYTNLRPCWAKENFSKNDWIEVDGKKVQARRWKKKTQQVHDSGVPLLCQPPK